MNRITRGIASTQLMIEEKLASGQVTQEKLDALSKSLDMDLGEYVRFQELKSLAATDGTLTMEEAQTIYHFLGESLDTFNNQPVDVKVALTKVFSELLRKRMAA